MSEKIKKIFAIFILVCIVTVNVSFAATTNLNINGILEINEEYEEWLKVPEEEKANELSRKIPSSYNIELKNGIVRSKFKKLLNEDTVEIGERFNLAEQIEVNVKDQGNTGACWAFATVSAIETFMAMKNNNIFDEYSASHMDYTMSAKSFTDGTNEKGLNRYVNSGGNSTMAGAYLASAKGVVLAEDMPFVDGVLTNGVNNNSAEKIKLAQIDQDVSKVVKSYRRFPDIQKNSTSGKVVYNKGENTQEEVDAIRKEMKEFIMTKGAITGSVFAHYNFYNIEKVQSGKTDKYAVFCNNSAYANHAVTIVGWDDNFSRDNFNDSCKPINDGAWIVLNSWGTDEESYTNDGYIYVSYDDAWIETDMIGIERVTEIDYENLYEHDEFGSSASIKGNLVNIQDVWLANVYDTKEKGVEELKEIGIFLTGTQNVEVYTNVTGDDFSKLEKVAAPGVLEPGYKTIQLTTPKTITGDKFIVAVRYTNDEGISIPIEMNSTDNGSSNSVYNVVKAELGQSYISTDGIEYVDLLKKEFKNDTSTTMFKNTNFCIKAYTGKKEPAKAESIILDKSKITLKQGETSKLTATVLPDDAINKEVTYASSNPAIATVDEVGNITALAAGTTTITVESKEVPTVKATCEVTVQKKEDFTLSLDKIEVTIKKGEKITINPIFTPTEVENKEVTWNSSNEAVATVDENGQVTAISAGTAIITVTSVAEPEKTATCEITVTDIIRVESVSIDILEKELKVGETIQLTETVAPANAEDKTVTWKSSDELVASVDTTGKVTALASGTAIITVTTNDGSKIATSTITVVNDDVEIEDKEEFLLELDTTTITLNKGENTILKPIFTPAEVLNKAVTWMSSNENVAKVNENGIITAVSAGTATITVTSVSNPEKTATCEITVTDIISVESVSIDIVEKELKVGETVQLTAIVAPENATDKTVTWKTSDETVADIDANGKVTAKASGTATITVTTNDGNKAATSTITVVNKNTGVRVESIQLNKTQIQMQVGDQTSLAVTFTPPNATNKNVTWVVDNKSVATVDKNGIITAIGKGTAKLTVTTEDGNKIAVATITVIEKTNTDDDIYKPDQNKQGSSEEGDSTTAEGKLPYTGKTKILAIVIIITGYGMIKKVKHRKLKDVK